MLDGRVARMTGASSRFGVEYDSLSDLIAFGVAPGLLAYVWALKGYGRFGWLAAFLYVACGALRLARFNIQADNVQKRQFLGLPIPAAATTIASTVLLNPSLHLFGIDLKTGFLPILVYIIAFLMVSNVRYINFKELGFFKGRPFRSTLIAILFIVVVFNEPKVTLFAMSFVYLLSGPLYTLMKRKKVISKVEPYSKEALSGQDGCL